MTGNPFDPARTSYATGTLDGLRTARADLDRRIEAAGQDPPARTSYPADAGIEDPRGWGQLRADILTAVRAARIRDTAGIVDAVLNLIGDEAVSRLAAELMADTRIKAMNFRDGGSMELEASRELVALWVGAARGILGGAVNYSETEFDFGTADPPGTEMTVSVAGDPEQYVFRLQRRGRLTPHQARVAAETERDGYRDLVAALRRGDQLTAGQQDLRARA